MLSPNSSPLTATSLEASSFFVARGQLTTLKASQTSCYTLLFSRPDLI